MNVFLSHASSKEVRGGVETYASYLSRVFPGLIQLDYHSKKDLLGDTLLPVFIEPERAKKLGEYFSKNFKNDTAFTNGMFCWISFDKEQTVFLQEKSLFVKGNDYKMCDEASNYLLYPWYFGRKYNCVAF